MGEIQIGGALEHAVDIELKEVGAANADDVIPGVGGDQNGGIHLGVGKAGAFSAGGVLAGDIEIKDVAVGVGHIWISVFAQAKTFEVVCILVLFENDVLMPGVPGSAESAVERTEINPSFHG